MKLVHNITISVFASELEDLEAISEKLLQFLPEDLEKEKLKIEIKDVKVEEGQDMKILKVYLEKQRHTKVCLEKLKEILGSKNSAEIAKDETRVDDEGRMYIRFDKKIFLDENKVKLVDHGDCVHFKLTLACFPKNKDRAMHICKEVFSNE